MTVEQKDGKIEALETSNKEAFERNKIEFDQISIQLTQSNDKITDLNAEKAALENTQGSILIHYSLYLLIIHYKI